MSRSSAPGKIILFGEHAVVYGRPALAVPVTQVQARVEVTAASRPGIWIDAPQVDLHAELSSLSSDHPVAAVVHNLLFSLGFSPFPALQITIDSTIPVASGLGSGAAVSVALVRALSSHLGHAMSDELVNSFVYEIEKLHHGTPSGIDNTVITYARPVYYIKGWKLETLNVPRSFMLVIGDTGIPAPTKESVSDVQRLWEADPALFESLFDVAGELANLARVRIETGETGALGELMDRNHALLQQMTVSSPELDRLVEAARQAGALGAKMSGGGRGGNMIALAEAETAEGVASALVAAGAKHALITPVENRSTG